MMMTMMIQNHPVVFVFLCLILLRFIAHFHYRDQMKLTERLSSVESSAAATSWTATTTTATDDYGTMVPGKGNALSQIDENTSQANDEESMMDREEESSESSTATVVLGGETTTTETSEEQKNGERGKSPPVRVRSGDLKKDPPIRVQSGDFIYRRGDWDGAPVVVESHKLVFFPIAKVGCTVWYQLFRRMMGHEDWNVEDYDKMVPWNPVTNGLRYLYDYDAETATHMMTSQEWTRAVFVREPKVRLLSAYLDKAVQNPRYLLGSACCNWNQECVDTASQSLGNFLDLAVQCDNTHWRPQHQRMDKKFWQTVNFVGHMETVTDDARRLLQQIGAWNECGASGWGDSGQDGAIFQAKAGGAGRRHATDARTKLQSHMMTAELEEKIERFYADDYSNAVMNITKISVF
jgi:hypothetical protein